MTLIKKKKKNKADLYTHKFIRADVDWGLFCSSKWILLYFRISNCNFNCFLISPVVYFSMDILYWRGLADAWRNVYKFLMYLCIFIFINFMLKYIQVCHIFIYSDFPFPLAFPAFLLFLKKLKLYKLKVLRVISFMRFT